MSSGLKSSFLNTDMVISNRIECFFVNFINSLSPLFIEYFLLQPVSRSVEINPKIEQSQITLQKKSDLGLSPLVAWICRSHYSQDSISMVRHPPWQGFVSLE